MLVAIIVFAAIVVIAFTCEYYAIKTGVPTVSSYPSAQRKIVATLQKDFATCPQGQPYTIIDLGSGGGQLACRIAKAIPQAKMIGIEISIFPWLLSKIFKWIFDCSNLTLKRADFWPYDCSEADAVVIFVTGNILGRLSEKLKRELKPGALIIANDATLHGDWKPIEQQDNKLFGLFDSKIYIYRKA